MWAKRKGRFNRKRGAFIIDVLIGVFVFAMGVAAFYTLMPMFRSGQLISRYESRATMMANRMIEHLQTLRPQELTPTVLEGLNLVDPGETESPFSFTNIPMDEGSGYSPAQMLPEGKAQLEFEDLDAGSIRAKITITWRGSSNESAKLSCGTIIGGYR